MTATARPRARIGERGLTLIETIVTIAIMTIGVLGIALSLSSSQLLARAATTQAQLAASARFISDDLRSVGVPYIPCATTASYRGTVTALQPQLPPTVSPTINRLDLVAPSGHNASGVLASCGDWGVQRISLTLTDTPSGRTLQRVVYKTWHP